MNLIADEYIFGCMHTHPEHAVLGLGTTPLDGYRVALFKGLSSSFATNGGEGQHVAGIAGMKCPVPRGEDIHPCIGGLLSKCLDRMVLPVSA